MNRRLVIVWVLLLCSIIGQASGIDREEARRRAVSFLQEGRNRQARRLAPMVQQTALDCVMDGGRYYVFNIGQDKGFVIVGATGDVLGYGDEGAFCADVLPQNVRAWLEGYGDEMRYMEEHGGLSEKQTTQTARRAKAKNAVAPLLTCLWNQGSPYNTLCPMDGSSHSVTGCVATAMAQMMYYHRMENRNALSATVEYTKNSKTVAALPATTIDWMLLQDDYSDTYTEAAATAMATLMQYAGAAVKMDYSASVSNAYAKDIPAALSGCFGYDGDAAVISRNNYTYEDWVDIVYKELTENGPVIYCGQSTGGGHAFVVDGYDEEDYFHVNWGWGGVSNGYFRLSVMNPYEQGIGGSTAKSGFDFMQDIIVNVHPQDNGISETVPQATANSSASLSQSGWALGGNGTASVGSPCTVTVNVKNTASEDYEGDLRLGALPVNKQTIFGNTIYLPTGESGVILASQWVRIAAGETKTVSYTFTPTTAKIYAISVLDKTVAIDNLSLSALAGYTTLTVSSAVSTTLTMNSAPVLTYNVKSASEFYGPLLGVTFTLQSSAAYDGSVLTRLIDETGNIIATELLQGSFTAGGTQTFSVAFGGLTEDKNYRVQVFNGTDMTMVGSTYSFNSVAGLTTYDANGTITSVALTATVTAPADALAVDMSAGGVTLVTPNSNPNTLYIVAPTDNPNGLEGCNVIRDGMAETLTLHDGYSFYSPVDFEAREVSYTRTFENGTTGTGGWGTIVLPFDVATVRCGERTIDWFHSGSDEGKHFWVKEFVSDASNSVTFDYADRMQANVPYIIAVPGNRWGEAWNLTGKSIVFSAENVTINAQASPTVSGGNYKFAGCTSKQMASNCYVTNAAGNAFIYSSSAEVDAFHACFVPFEYLSWSAPQTLSIVSPDDGNATSIDRTQNMIDEKPTAVYSLAGVRVGHGVEQLPHGIYVRDGKKVVVK